MATMIDGLDVMFAEAKRRRLWFHSAYQDLWFSPAQLAAEQERGNFRWGAPNWTLRDPREHVTELRANAVALNAEADRIQRMIDVA